MKDNMNSIIEAAFWAGFEPSSDDLTEAALYEEAKAYLEKSIQYYPNKIFKYGNNDSDKRKDPATGFE